MFTYLGVKTEYSFDNSIITIDRLIKACLKKNISTICISDKDNMCACVQFSQQSIKNGIKPIIGCDITIEEKKSQYSLKIIAKSEEGWQSISSFLSKKSLNKGIIKKQWLSCLKNVVIILSFVKEEISDKSYNQLEEIINFYKQISKDLFIAISRVGRPEEEKIIANSLNICQYFRLPVVAVNDIFFIQEEEFITHEIRVGIKKNYLLNDPTREKIHFQGEYLKDPKSMIELFKDIPASIDNGIHIGKICNFAVKTSTIMCPPKFNCKNSEEKLKIEAEKGLIKKNLPEIYKKRLKQELDFICKFGFQDYFLIVWDMVGWAKNNDIPVGPGRGSVASSLVAFCLEITEVDPIKYNLIFARFINPERVTLPDIDIDFCQIKREKVIEYVISKYGKEKVAQIATFNSFMPKSAIRDVGRVIGMSYRYVDKIAKLVPNNPNITIESCMQTVEELIKIYNTDKNVKKLIDQAKKIEGLKKTISTHAAGVVIAPEDIYKYTPLYYEQGSDRIITQLDMKDIQQVGLIKFDILGIKTLSISKAALKLSEKINKIDCIPEEDYLTFKNISQGFCHGVFQLDSIGIRKLAVRIKPKNILDIATLISLYRPGPLISGMVEQYVEMKERSEISTMLPEKIRYITEETYGLILYQEQIMYIANIMSNFSLGKGSILLKAIGKKDTAIMQSLKKDFIIAGINNGFKSDEVEHTFHIIEEFAKYGFNKAHAVSYAIETYRTAYIKTHYAKQMLASLISFDMDNSEKINKHLRECFRLEIKVLKPCIKNSKYYCTLEEGSIRLGLGIIKGIGIKQYNKIKNIEVNNISQEIPKSMLQSLSYAGALDVLNEDRTSIAEKRHGSKLKIHTSKTSKQDEKDKLLIKKETSLLTIPIEKKYFKRIAYYKCNYSSPIALLSKPGSICGVVIDKKIWNKNSSTITIFDYQCFIEVKMSLDISEINIGQIIKIKTNKRSYFDRFVNAYKVYGIDMEII